MPWPEPYYYHNTRDRRAIDLEVMMRMHFLQAWFNLSDAKTERECRRNIAYIRFWGIGLIDERAPDATTLCKFRNLLVENRIGKKIFDDVAERLERAGLRCMEALLSIQQLLAPEIDKEQGEKARPRNAPDKEGGTAVLWGEGAHRR